MLTITFFQRFGSFNGVAWQNGVGRTCADTSYIYMLVQQLETNALLQIEFKNEETNLVSHKPGVCTGSFGAKKYGELCTFKSFSGNSIYPNVHAACTCAGSNVALLEGKEDKLDKLQCPLPKDKEMLHRWHRYFCFLPTF